jgi:spore coat polysaccharide biosynthesis protein SpsF (cytidylyltransferase family)
VTGASFPRIAVIVQARTTSARLPGKVLLPLAGAPAIARMWERVARIRCAQAHILATSTDPSDDALADVCRAHRIDVVRGPLDDVLARFVAALPEDADAVVRLTGDCPLVDPVLVDRHIERFVAAGGAAEYVTNAVVRTMPDGLDVEVVSRRALLDAHEHATRPADREHVLPWVARHTRVTHVTDPVDLSDLRLTLDTPDDYAALAAIYEDLYRTNPRFGARDVYHRLVQRPEWIRFAPGIARDDVRVADAVARLGSQLAHFDAESAP